MGIGGGMDERTITAFRITAFWDDTGEGVDNDPVSITDVESTEELHDLIKSEMVAALKWHTKTPRSLTVSYLNHTGRCVDSYTVYL